MKKRKLFTAFGIVILTITGIMSTKQKNRFFTLSVKNAFSFCNVTAASGSLPQPPFTTNAAIAITTVYVGLFTTNLNILCGSVVVTSVGQHKVFYAGM